MAGVGISTRIPAKPDRIEQRSTATRLAPGNSVRHDDAFHIDQIEIELPPTDVFDGSERFGAQHVWKSA